ncbi:hypothetical protein [Polluticaenibacter yanchengensis]|uniref:Tetratricopeptide repeat protein n=1 Tax=Polluticaenibacter yanchengensis TaxID=3014562 RepID=A0ABT4UHU9_9BACT|nr:hypothetical protein [Chitinophagaceae bacterium LY-5]
MNSVLQEIKSTFHLQMTDSFEAVDFGEEMRDLLKEYPWFGLGWLTIATESDIKIQQKANLWYNNSFLLNSLLQGSESSENWLKEALLDLDTLPLVEKEEADLNEAIEEIELKTEIAPELPETFNEELTAAGVNNKATEPGTIITEAIIEAGEIQPQQQEMPDETALNPLSETAEKILATLQSINLEDDENAAKQKLSYETYHIIDYFASQGIEITAEDLNKDSFGKQVKSFTQWLKTTKKIVQNAYNEGPIDPLVEAQAKASLSEKEVLTEAMAQVLVKQGKNRKAIELYGKLILLYPEKSHYFANRIKEINE